MESSAQWSVLKNVGGIEHILTMMVELEKRRKIFCATVGVTRIRKSSSWIPQLIKEWMNHGLDRRESLSWCVLEQFRDEVNCGWVSFSENLHR